jgi:molybdate transport system ATP-binding protein
MAGPRSTEARPVASDKRTLHVEVYKRHAPGRSSRFQLEAKLAVYPGVTVIVGHSGAGKTTLLRCIAGLSNPEAGRIAIGEHVLFDSRKNISLEPARRWVAFVFQDLALFPHLSVEDNVMYGLRRLELAERKRRMREILVSFQIEHLEGRFPRQISGGEQQRVALARSLVTEPKVLLLDEPLSSLDPHTKVLIIDDLRRWNETRRIPILYVTHDHDELLALGDRAIVLDHGKVVTEGSPLDVMPNPLRLATAQKERFENVFDATVVELRTQNGTMVCELTGTSIQVELPLAEVAVGSEVCVGIRADDILLASSQPTVLGDCNVIRGKITQVARRGAIVEARVSCGAAFRVHLTSQSIAFDGLDASPDIWMVIRTRACHLVRSSLFETLQRLFVFVCQGNTIRSPMAQMFCDVEIAARLGVPLESLDRLGIKAVSAGLTAQPGEALAAEVEQALSAIGVPALEHRSRNLTHAMAHRAEVIFCMTENQRTEVTARFPETAAKTHCLHPDADVGDPHGTSADTLAELAGQIQELVKQKLDGLGVPRAGGPAQPSLSTRSPRRTIEVSTSAEAEANVEGSLRYATRPTSGPV